MPVLYIFVVSEKFSDVAFTNKNDRQVRTLQKVNIFCRFVFNNIACVDNNFVSHYNRCHCCLVCTAYIFKFMLYDSFVCLHRDFSMMRPCPKMKFLCVHFVWLYFFVCSSHADEIWFRDCAIEITLELQKIPLNSDGMNTNSSRANCRLMYLYAADRQLPAFLQQFVALTQISYS